MQEEGRPTVVGAPLFESVDGRTQPIGWAGGYMIGSAGRSAGPFRFMWNSPKWPEAT